MSKSKPTVRGRGEEILGRGVDALFSAPPATETTPASPPLAAAASAPLDAEAESALDALLETEMREIGRAHV